MANFPPGTFGWVELATSDRESARAFYTSLLGLSNNDVDMPGDMGGKYTLLQLEGKDIAGMHSLMKEQAKQGIPPHWLSYVMVESADASSAKVSELGGTVMMPPFDVPGVGRMSVVQDPTGATFALFQAGDHGGTANLGNKAGTFCWNELATRDTAAAKAFYTGLFGWSIEDQDIGHMGTYTTFKNGERVAAGMYTISKEMGDIPPNWAVYFSVNDCDGTVEKAKAAGANVIVPGTDIPEIGRFSVLADPQGAVFAVIKLLNPEPN